MEARFKKKRVCDQDFSRNINNMIKSRFTLKPQFPATSKIAMKPQWPPQLKTLNESAKKIIIV